MRPLVILFKRFCVSFSFWDFFSGQVWLGVFVGRFASLMLYIRAATKVGGIWAKAYLTSMEFSTKRTFGHKHVAVSSYNIEHLQQKHISFHL